MKTLLHKESSSSTIFVTEASSSSSSAASVSTHPSTASLSESDDSDSTASTRTIEDEEDEVMEPALEINDLEHTSQTTTKTPFTQDTENTEERSLQLQNPSSFSKAEEYYAKDKLSNAATILKSLDPTILTQKHRDILSQAKDVQTLVKDLRSTSNSTSTSTNHQTKWVDQGVSKGKIPTRILYKLDMDKVDEEGNAQLTVVCESPIEKDLLAPLLFVLNETDLYTTWLPRFRAPRFEFRQSKKLKQSGPLSQILHLVIDLAWPLSPREIVLNASAFDCIEEDGYMGIQLKPISPEQDKVVPIIDSRKSVEVLLDGGFLFEKCPKDHPCMAVKDHDNDDDDDESIILTKFCFILHPNLKVIPQTLLKFLLRVGVRKIWKILMKVAKDVQDDQRPVYTEAMTEKKGFSDYLKDRVNVLLKEV